MLEANKNGEDVFNVTRTIIDELNTTKNPEEKITLQEKDFFKKFLTPEKIHEARTQIVNLLDEASEAGNPAIKEEVAQFKADHPDDFRDISYKGEQISVRLYNSLPEGKAAMANQGAAASLDASENDAPVTFKV